MDILTYVDLHGSLKGMDELQAKVKAHQPDLVVCAGDISVFETDIESIMMRLDNFGVRHLMIHGNHESEERMKMLCKKYHHTVFLHKKKHVVDNVLFLGYGGGGFSREDEEFEEWGKEMESTIRKAKLQAMKVVLLVHGPPHNTRVDYIYGNHVGNKSFSSFIKKNMVDVVICGHLHENAGKQGTIGNCLVLNPGPTGKLISL